jgi:ATP-dependent exoDNAse (exonuclease V) beta subunit
MTAATTAPRLGQGAVPVDKADDGDLALWSVTTILGALDKPALLYWAAEQTAEAAIDNTATWQAMLAERGRAEAVKWLRDARFRRPRNKLSAKDLGTVVHQLCEEYALTSVRPDRNRIAELIRVKGGEQVDVRAEGPVVLAMLQQFDNWLQRFTPAYVATEVAVYSPTYGYAGQSDGFVVIDGTRMIIDYKTSREPRDSKGDPRTPYPEQVGLQLAAYRWAEFAAVWRPRRLEKFRRRYYLLGDAERAMAEPVPQVDGGLAIQITPESCEAYPIRCDEETHRAFLFTIEVFRWLQETSKTAMGPALESTGD